MSDPLGGTPIRDYPGTVRGEKNSGAWVKVGRVGSAEQDSWVDTTRGERVSDYVMWLMRLPVVGVTPGSLADHDRRQRTEDRPTLPPEFVPAAAALLGEDPDILLDDLLDLVIGALSALDRHARDTGRPVDQVIHEMVEGPAPMHQHPRPDRPGGHP